MSFFYNFLEPFIFSAWRTTLWTFWLFISLSSQTIPLNKLTTLLLAGAGPRFQTVRVGHVQQMTVCFLRGFIASQGRQRGIVGQRSAGRGRSVLKQMESGGNLWFWHQRKSHSAAVLPQWHPPLDRVQKGFTTHTLSFSIWPHFYFNIATLKRSASAKQPQTNTFQKLLILKHRWFTKQLCQCCMQYYNVLPTIQFKITLYNKV